MISIISVRYYLSKENTENIGCQIFFKLFLTEGVKLYSQR